MKFSLMFFSASGSEMSGDSGGRYDLLMDAVRLIDNSAVSAVWLPERHFAEFGGLYPNPAVLGAAVARETSCIRIRAGSVILPLQDPLRVVEEWSVVDNLSDGRVEVSFGSGWNVNDFVLAPKHYDDRRAIMHEGIDTVRRLWRGERVERVNGVGRSVQIGTLPRPVQPELPVWLTSQSEAGFAHAGSTGEPVLTNLNFNSPKILARNCEVYRENLPEGGSERAQVALMVHTFVGTDDASARRTVADPLRGYLRSNLDLRAQFAEGKSGERPEVAAAQVDAIIERGVDRILDWAGLIGGDVGTLAEKVAYFAAQGVDELVCLVDFGIDLDDTQAGIVRLCELADLMAH